MLTKLKNNKAFTLIELIVVIAVLGILVLLAALKFLGHTQDAKMAQIKNDIRVHENVIEEQMIKANIKGEDYFENLSKINADKLEEFRDKNSLYDRKGLVSESEEFADEYFEYPEGLVNTRLKGDFFVSQGGKVYYHEEGLGGKVYYHEEGLDGNEQSEYLLSDDDFEWVDSSEGYIGLNGETGYFRYIGTGKETIEIPHVIQGIEMTSYFRMFHETGINVKKIISTNVNVTDMSQMFAYSYATSLDLSSFDTSKVTNMRWMFAGSYVTTLDLSNFDTSNVTDMSMMFAYLQAESLDLSSFDTSNVTTMSYMFSYSQAKSLNLSSFDTSKVTDMSGMFVLSQATLLDLSSFDTSNVTDMNSMFFSSHATTGYALTQDDADRFNSSSGKSEGLTFTVKQSE